MEGLQWGLEEPKMELNGPRKDFRFKTWEGLRRSKKSFGGSLESLGGLQRELGEPQRPVRASKGVGELPESTP